MFESNWLKYKKQVILFLINMHLCNNKIEDCYNLFFLPNWQQKKNREARKPENLNFWFFWIFLNFSHFFFQFFILFCSKNSCCACKLFGRKQINSNLLKIYKFYSRCRSIIMISMTKFKINYLLFWNWCQVNQSCVIELNWIEYVYVSKVRKKIKILKVNFF